MNVMIDLNVLLDVFQEREPHYRFSSIVLSEILKGNLKGVIPAHALTTIHYIISKYLNCQKADEKIDWILEKFEISPADRIVFENARAFDIDDFEDAVVSSMAQISECDYIITRNVFDFKKSSVPAITPQLFIAKLGINYGE